MINFIIWIASSDKELSREWYNLFTRESLQTIQLTGLDGFSLPQDTWGLIFAEVGAPGMASPKDLAQFISGRKNASVIAFSKTDKTTNAIISAYLESGADDFVKSDIDKVVLLAKTKAHIRRLLPNLNAARTVLLSKNGDIEVDRLKRTVKTDFGTKKEKILDKLTPKEFDLIYTFIMKETEVVPRSLLMDEVWKEKAVDVNSETVDKHVETLRKKLGSYGKNIRTVYGTGYIYKTE